MASMKFPLYYPAKLPPGYKINRKSITEPQANIVVITVVGPEGRKFYMSEQALPSSFSVPDYAKKFSNLQEENMSDGLIAVGKLANGQEVIGSWSNTTTWIITNGRSGRAPSPGQLLAMLKSLRLSY